MKSKKKAHEVPFTLQSFGLFVEKVVKPVLEGLKKESTVIHKEVEKIFSRCTYLAKKLDALHREYLTISDQTRRIELRIQGATQQAVLVLREQMETLRKRVEEIETTKPRNYH